MVRHSAKKNKKDLPSNFVDHSPVTRLMLKKLSRAKAVPEIYKEVVRSKRRKNLRFQVPDVNYNSLQKIEQNNQQLDSNAFDNEQILTINYTSRPSEDCLTDRSPEKEINVTVASDLTECKTAKNSSVSTCTSPDKHEEHLLKDCTVLLKDLKQDKNSLTDSEPTIVAMPPKDSRARKSASIDTRSVSSPGVVTRSQLKQLANSKIVPEEYKNVVTENQSHVGTGKQQKSSDKRRKSILNTTPKRQRGSNRQSDKETSFEQSSSAVEQGIENTEVGNIHDFPVENNSELTNKTGRNRSKNKKENEGDSGGLRNVKRNEDTCEIDSNSVNISQNDSESDEQTVSEMNVSDIENQEGSEGQSSAAKSKISKQHISEMPDHRRNTSKRAAEEKVVKSHKIDNMQGQEILDSLHSKTRTAILREQCVSICEPVDMSISEDCSGTEKILYCVNSESSDSEASGTFLEHSKKTLGDSSTQGKPVPFKREKNSIINKEVKKLPATSSATSSSYTSAYEITPLKSQSKSKECSLSTKTTDSGIAVMADSNPFGDTDSSTVGKQENDDTAQQFNSNNDTAFKGKDEQIGIPGKKPVVNNTLNTTKQTNLLSNENTPSGSGKPIHARQEPFLVRMPVSVDEDIDSDSDAESRKAIMLSAQRRIEQNLSTTDSEGRRMSHQQTPSSSLNGGEDSDDAPPDSMSFETGRNIASESLRDAVESISRDRQRRKERRRVRLEKLRQQKEEKLIRLKERLASQEDASCSSSEESGYEDEELRHFKKKPLRDRAKAERSQSKKRSSNVDDGQLLKPRDLDDETQMKPDLISGSDVSKRLPHDLLERLSEKAPTQMKVPQSGKTDEMGNKNRISAQVKRKKATPHSEQSDELSELQSFKKPTTFDYIPLKSTSSTKFAVMPVDKIGNVSKTTAQKAAEFRQNMMFGNHHKREPANTNLIYQQKLKASGKDVFARKKY